MPPTRGHDLKLFRVGFTELEKSDAPHTGARLETGAAVDALCGVLMPPTRGHDLKHQRLPRESDLRQMPPTRGHDLKHRSALSVQRLRSMPPTRGHDLKPVVQQFNAIADKRCPPHGGTT